MESRVCGGCGGGGLVTLTTTSEDKDVQLHRLAYFQVVRDTPPVPVVPEHLAVMDNADGALRLKFYEIWNASVWRELFGDEPTVDKIGELARAGTLRVSKVIRSPSGIIRARIYDTENAAFEPDGDEMCEEMPTLHKNMTVRYRQTSIA